MLHSCRLGVLKALICLGKGLCNRALLLVPSKYPCCMGKEAPKQLWYVMSVVSSKIRGVQWVKLKQSRSGFWKVFCISALSVFRGTCLSYQHSLSILDLERSHKVLNTVKSVHGISHELRKSIAFLTMPSASSLYTFSSYFFKNQLWTGLAYTKHLFFAVICLFLSQLLAINVAKSQ